MSYLSRYSSRVLLILSLVLIGLFGFVGSASAVEFISEGTIEKGEKIDDDLFITAETIVVNGEINGDLFAAGETVTINGRVKGSLITAAQTIIIDGEIDGSVYGGGASLTLDSDADIGRNLLFGGFGLEAKQGSKVERDLFMGGYQAILDGNVGRNVRGALGALELSGKVGGDVEIEVGSREDRAPTTFFLPNASAMPDPIEPGLRISSDANIDGKLIYDSAVNQEDAIKAKPDGGIEFNQVVSGTAPKTTSQQIQGWLISQIGPFLTILLLGVLMLWRMPKPLVNMAEKARQQPVPATIWGLFALIGGWVGIVVLAFLIGAIGVLLSLVTFGGLGATVVGLGVSGIVFILTLFLLLVTYGSKVVVSYLGGKLIFSRLPKANNKYFLFVIGLIIYMLLSGIPYLGIVIASLATLIGLGAMWLQFRSKDNSSSGVVKEMPAV